MRVRSPQRHETCQYEGNMKSYEEIWGKYKEICHIFIIFLHIFDFFLHNCFIFPYISYIFLHIFFISQNLYKGKSSEFFQVPSTGRKGGGDPKISDLPLGKNFRGEASVKTCQNKPIPAYRGTRNFSSPFRGLIKFL